MTDYVILDTETMGLHPDAPVWEFAAIRLFADGGEDSTEFRIRHNPVGWLDDFPEQFSNDYRNRYQTHDALDEASAAVMIHLITRGATVFGSNPGFDLERLTKLLHRNGLEPAWHYHPLDSSSLIIGYLRGLGRPLPDTLESNQLSAAIGVNPDDYHRHTAMGDVLWTRAIWNTVIGGQAA